MEFLAETVEAVGLVLAVLDFWGLSRWLEKQFDRLLYFLKKLIGKWRGDWEYYSAYLKVAAITIVALIAMILYEMQIIEDNSVMIAIFLGGAYPVAVFLFFCVAYGILHILNKAPSGIVGSIGLLTALGGYALSHREWILTHLGFD